MSKKVVTETLGEKFDQFISTLKEDQMLLSKNIPSNKVGGLSKEVLDAKTVVSHYAEVLRLMDQIKMVHPGNLYPVQDKEEKK